MENKEKIKGFQEKHICNSDHDKHHFMKKDSEDSAGEEEEEERKKERKKEREKERKKERNRMHEPGRQN